MIDIPLGKALVPVEMEKDAGNSCDGCVFHVDGMFHCYGIGCRKRHEDGKDIIFKLVDYPVEEKK